MTKVTCVVQARTGSTRLPGKVLLDLGGRALLDFLLARLAPLDLAIVVATSDRPADDPIEQLARARGIAVARGDEHDVLGRFGLAIDAHPCDHVVRLTADSPLVDPSMVSAAVAHHLDTGADYTSNTLARTYPDGLDVEVIRASVLAEAQAEATDPDEREHVTPFVYRHPERFALAALCSGEQLGTERWTVDTPDDLERLRTIVDRLADPITAGWRDVLAIAGRLAAPGPGELWLRPECWSGVSFRRRWDVVIDDAAAGSVEAVLLGSGAAELRYEGRDDLEDEARRLAREALRADKQISTLLT